MLPQTFGLQVNAAPPVSGPGPYQSRAVYVWLSIASTVPTNLFPNLDGPSARSSWAVSTSTPVSR